jgi:hypothetical protein
VVHRPWQLPLAHLNQRFSAWNGLAWCLSSKHRVGLRPSYTTPQPGCVHLEAVTFIDRVVVSWV